MVILPDPVLFEWDKGNKDKNVKKHQITNQEAEEIFQNESKFIFEDEAHSTLETRYGLYGKTNKVKLLSIVFTIRKDRIRIITARPMSRKERRAYEEIKKDSTIQK